MSGSLHDLTVRDFLDAVAARTSAPGGGAAAGTVTALAAALVAMAARFGEPGPGTDELVEQAEALRRRAAPLADPDAAAYQRYLQAARDHDRSGSEVEQALSAATDVPAEIADVAAAVAELAARVLDGGNPRLHGDAATGAVLAAAAARAASGLVAENTAAADDRVAGSRAAAARAEKHAAAGERLQGGGR